MNNSNGNPMSIQIPQPVGFQNVQPSDSSTNYNQPMFPNMSRNNQITSPAYEDYKKPNANSQVFTNEPRTPILGNQDYRDSDRMDENIVPRMKTGEDKNNVVDDSMNAIDIELKKYGYTPVDRVTVTKPNCPITTFVKARSPLGFYVFVEIDTPGFISYSEKDLSMVETLKGRVLPISESYKRGVYDDVGDSAIMCKDGMCKLGYDPESTNPRESNYTYVSETHDASISPEDSPVAYPVISMKEIKTNPGKVLEMTSAATARLRRASYENVVAGMHSYMKEVESLVISSNNFAIKQKETATALSEVLGELMTYQNQYQKLPPGAQTSDSDIKRQKLVEYNLNDRNDLTILLLNICDNVKNLTDDVEKISQHMQSYNSMLNTRFSTLKSLKTPPIL